MELPLLDPVVNLVSTYLSDDPRSIASFSAACRYSRFLLTRHPTLGERLWTRLFAGAFGRELRRGPGDGKLTAFALFSRKMNRRALKRPPVIFQLCGGGGGAARYAALVAGGGNGERGGGDCATAALAFAVHDSGAATVWMPRLHRPLLPPSAVGDIGACALSAKARRDAKLKYSDTARGSKAAPLLFFKLAARAGGGSEMRGLSLWTDDECEPAAAPPGAEDTGSGPLAALPSVAGETHDRFASVGGGGRPLWVAVLLMHRVRVFRRTGEKTTLVEGWVRSSRSLTGRWEGEATRRMLNIETAVL